MSLYRSATHLGNVHIQPRAAKGHDATAGLRLYALNADESTGVERWRVTPTAMKFNSTAMNFKGITGAHANWGMRMILTAGSSVVTNNKVGVSSLISLTPAVNTGITGVGCWEQFSRRAANTFKIMLFKSGNLSATGRVYFRIVNS